MYIMFQFKDLSLPVLAAIFLGCAAAIWIAGIYVSRKTDVLAEHFGLGEALGGLILLAIVTNLPELIITISASLQGNVGLAVGNILGGIALQTVVLVLLDKVGMGKAEGLTRQASTMQIVLEGLLVVVVLVLVVIGHEMPASMIDFRVTPVGVLIVIAWIIGLLLINKAKDNFAWVPKDKPARPAGHAMVSGTKEPISITMIIFLIAALVTMAAGYGVERSGDALAEKLGMEGIIFGATIMAAATALPEVSTGLASMKLKKYDMAVSDIFGGNAFLPVLFLVATICSGKAVLPEATSTDIYLTALAMLPTLIYVYGLLFKPAKQVFGMGVDSFVVLLVYIAGIGGLFMLA